MSDEAIREKLETSAQRANLWSKREKTVILGAIAGLCITLMVAAIIITWNLVPALDAWKKSSKASAEEVPKAISAATNVLVSGGKQLEVLGTKGAIALEKVGAVADTLNAETVPAATNTIRQLGNATEKAGSNTADISRAVVDAINELKKQEDMNGSAVASSLAELSKFVSSTNASVNEKLVPEIVRGVQASTKVMERFAVSADEATGLLKQVSEKSGKSLDEINRWITDPRWSKMLDEWLAVSGNVERTSANISKFSKVSIIVSLLSRAASALIPGLLN